MTSAPRFDGTLKPEAAELPVVLAKLTDALARLNSRPAEPPLAFRKHESARLCGISPRLLERLLAAGKFPRPDAYAGRCPLWTRATLSDWIGKGGGRI
jgi:predicted DNA-binding transcriptional regulator AlpA